MPVVELDGLRSSADRLPTAPGRLASSRPRTDEAPSGRPCRCPAPLPSGPWRRFGSAAWRCRTACSCTARRPGRCAVRDADGAIKVGLRAQARVSRAGVQTPLLRGPLRLAEAFASSRSCGGRCRRRASRSSGPAVLGAIVGASAVYRRARPRRTSARAARELVAGWRRSLPAAARAARRRARRVPRRRARLDRDLRVGEPAREGARALRLASDRAAARHDRRGERRSRRSAPRTARPAARRSAPSARVGARSRSSRWMTRHPEQPARARARAARATSCSTASPPPSRAPSSSRSPRPRSRPACELEHVDAEHVTAPPRRAQAARRRRSSTCRSRRCARATTPTRTSTTRARRCSPTAATRGS